MADDTTKEGTDLLKAVETTLQAATSADAPQAILDLRGESHATALAALEEIVDGSRPDLPQRIAILYDAASPGGGETLFQPLTRRLLEARRQGHIVAFGLHPDEGNAGFVVTLSATADVTDGNKTGS